MVKGIVKFWCSVAKELAQVVDFTSLGVHVTAPVDYLRVLRIATKRAHKGMQLSISSCSH